MLQRLIGLVLLLTTSAFAEVSLEHTKDTIIYNFNIEQFTFSKIKINNKYFNKINLAGVEKYQALKYNVGSPELPVLRLLVPALPEVISETKNLLIKNSNNLPMAPAQAPRLKKPNIINNLAFDQKKYNSESFFPNQVYTLEEAGSIRGQKQYMLTLYPVAYAPKKNHYKFINKFTVKIPIIKPKQESSPPVFAFIVAHKFKDSLSLKHYEEFKTKLGFKVIRILVNPNDTALSIRNRLKKLYAATNLRHALIFGDAELVKAKDSSIISGVTDHYYRALDTDNYDTDINGPDIGVGRISVKTKEDLQAVIKKYINYEKGFFNEQNWLKSASFLATNDQYRIAEGSHNYAIENYTQALGYTGFFPTTGESGGDKLYAVTHNAQQSNVQEALALGRVIINYSGHGAPDLWDAPHMDQNDVRALKHGDATAFVVSNACVTGQFTKDESFAETWQRHPYGAVMFWGSMDNTYWDEDDILERSMYDGIFRDGLSTFQEITDNALTHLWLYYGGQGNAAYYWESYVVFGDPSQALRTNYTQVPVVAGDRIVSMDREKINYIITDVEARPIKNAQIILTAHNKPLTLTGTTDEFGKAEISLKDLVNEATVFKVIIRGQNLVLSATELSITSDF